MKINRALFLLVSVLLSFSANSKDNVFFDGEVKAPFGFKWGVSIDLVKKMEWVVKQNSNEFVCNSKVGSLITKCTNSYAPSPLMIDGDYSLFFDREKKLFKITFLTSGLFDSKEKKHGLYIKYKRYIDILGKKYGEPDIKIDSDGYFYQWGSGNPKIQISVRHDHSMVYLELSYFSKNASGIINSDNHYHKMYEQNIM